MKVLVTGASGFVGRALVDSFENSDIEVVASTRSDVKAFNKSVKKVITGNLSASQNWVNALSGVDVVIHLAARVHQMKSSEREALDVYREENVDATINLAKQSISQGVKRFIFMSTVKVNGEFTDSTAYSEIDEPCPEGAYAVSKYESEQALINLAAHSEMEITIIRPPLIYGPGVKGNFDLLIKAVKKRVPIPFKGIDNKRSLIGLSNLIDFIHLVMEDDRAKNEVYLIADVTTYSSYEMIQMIAKNYQIKERCFYFPSWLVYFACLLFRSMSSYKKVYGSLSIDTSKAKNQLGWHPKYDFHDEIRLIKESNNWKPQAKKNLL
jgi:nucleoside-diphosphate-sugar epimerase